MADNSAQAKDLKAAALAVGMLIIKRYRDLPPDRYVDLMASRYSVEERVRASAAFAPRATWARMAAQAGVDFCLARQAERASKRGDDGDSERGRGRGSGGGVGGRSPRWERVVESDWDTSESDDDARQKYQGGGGQRDTYTELDGDEGLVQEREASDVQDEQTVSDDERLGRESKGRSIKLKAHAADARDENGLIYNKWLWPKPEDDCVLQEDSISSIRGEDDARYDEWSPIGNPLANGVGAHSSKDRRMKVGAMHSDHKVGRSEAMAVVDDNIPGLPVSRIGSFRERSMPRESIGTATKMMSGSSGGYSEAFPAPSPRVVAGVSVAGDYGFHMSPSATVDAGLQLEMDEGPSRVMRGRRSAPTVARTGPIPRQRDPASREQYRHEKGRAGEGGICAREEGGWRRHGEDGQGARMGVTTDGERSSRKVVWGGEETILIDADEQEENAEGGGGVYRNARREEHRRTKTRASGGGMVSS